MSVFHQEEYLKCTHEKHLPGSFWDNDKGKITVKGLYFSTKLQADRKKKSKSSHTLFSTLFAFTHLAHRIPQKSLCGTRDALKDALDASQREDITE